MIGTSWLWSESNREGNRLRSNHALVMNHPVEHSFSYTRWMFVVVYGIQKWFLLREASVNNTAKNDALSFFMTTYRNNVNKRRKSAKQYETFNVRCARVCITIPRTRNMDAFVTKPIETTSQTRNEHKHTYKVKGGSTKWLTHKQQEFKKTGLWKLHCSCPFQSLKHACTKNG